MKITRHYYKIYCLKFSKIKPFNKEIKVTTNFNRNEKLFKRISIKFSVSQFEQF